MKLAVINVAALPGSQGASASEHGVPTSPARSSQADEFSSKRKEVGVGIRRFGKSLQRSVSRGGGCGGASTISHSPSLPHSPSGVALVSAQLFASPSESPSHPSGSPSLSSHVLSSDSPVGDGPRLVSGAFALPPLREPRAARISFGQRDVSRETGIHQSAQGVPEAATQMQQQSNESAQPRLHGELVDIDNDYYHDDEDPTMSYHEMGSIPMHAASGSGGTAL